MNTTLAVLERSSYATLHLEPTKGDEAMHQAYPVKDLPNGKHIYHDRGGTYSHQHPVEPWWCEKHRTIEEAFNCYKRMVREQAES